jgi:putative FmdB family regulatory protein
MPFYEYECADCKFYTEVMQKITDAPLKKCPSCGKPALKKLVSAPNFRLKGSGWYETDFKSEKEGQRNLAEAEKAEAKEAKPAETEQAKAGETKPAEAKTAAAKPAADRERPRKPARKAPAARRSAKARTKPKAKARPARKARRR